MLSGLRLTWWYVAGLSVISSEDAGQSHTECLNRRERCLKVETEHLQVASAKLHHLSMTKMNKLMQYQGLIDS